MPTFEDPTEKMEQAFEEVRALDRHSPRLNDVTIAVLAAYATRDKDDEPRGEALSRSGKPLLGKIRIMSLEDRTAGATDVRIVLHGDRWGQLTSAMQRFVIDECLTQIEVLVEDGKPKLDDIGRPKLRQCAFDYDIRGFTAVDAQWGRSSVPVNQMRVLFDRNGQTYLPLMDPDDRPQDFMTVAPVRTGTRTKAIAGKGSSYKRGKLKDAELRGRIDQIKAPATFLGVAKLELQHKPRKSVLSCINERVLELKLLLDYRAVENGEIPPGMELDLAAAVLVTSPKRPPIDVLEELVPECRDTQVLGWVIDDERDAIDPRTEVIDVVEARIAELTG